jgi:hypothetical protein
MTLTASEWVGRILDIVKDGVGPYILAKYRDKYPARSDAPAGYKDYLACIQEALVTNKFAPPKFPDDRSIKDWVDAYSWLSLIAERDRNLFHDLDGPARLYVHELIDFRNLWAHQRTLKEDDAYRAADDAARLLDKIGAAESAKKARAVADCIKRATWYQGDGYGLHLEAQSSEGDSDDHEATQRLTRYPGDVVEVCPPNETPWRYPLQKERTLVGRSVTNSDIRVKDQRVSRVHLQIARTPNGDLTITDLRSANGTAINGKLIAPNQPMIWSSKHSIQIGSSELRLSTEGNHQQA